MIRHAALLLLLAVPAQAARLATSPEMCSFGDGPLPEEGMILTETTMEAIEFFCEFDPAIPIDWNSDRTFARVGYCNEPGILMPQVFAFQYGTWNPGVIDVWFQDTDQPVVFTLCPGD